MWVWVGGVILECNGHISRYRAVRVYTYVILFSSLYQDETKSVYPETQYILADTASQ